MKPENISDVYPLSSTQEGMLFHTISDPNSGVYVEHVVVSLQGAIDLPKLVSSFEVVAALSDPLRTAFVWDGLDQPRQVVREKVVFPSQILDWRKYSPDEQSNVLTQLLATDKSTGFQLEAAPLIRANICLRGPDSLCFVLCFHHLVLDGWSVQILLKNIWQHYTTAALPTSTFRFRDYIQWLHHQNHDAARAFWGKELAGFSSPNQITALPRPADSPSDYRTETTLLTSSQSDRLKALARQNRLTLNTLLLAAWSLVVSRYSGGDKDIVFGTTVAGRPLTLAGIDQAIGSFINTLPFRTQIDRNQPLNEWFQSIQSSQVEYRDWEFSSLSEIQKHSDAPPGTSLFESILVFENYPASPSVDRNFEITGIDYFEHGNFPLALLVLPADIIELHLVLNEAIFPPPIGSQILEHVQFLLNEFVAHPQARLGEIPSLPTAQLAQLIPAPPAISTSAETILDHFARNAKRSPDSAAVRSDDSSLTYLQLDRKSSTVADYLRLRGVTPETPVGLCFERSTDLIVGMIGILKAGCAYLPLDPHYPSSHFQHVLQDARAALILTHPAHTSKFPDSFSDRLVTLEQALTQGTPPSTSSPVAPHNLAYLIYTSGSTGKPKGVKVTHANLLHSTLARTDFYETNPSRFLLLSSFAFDSSVAGIFWTLATGGCLILPPPDEEKDLERLAQRIERRSVTHLLCLPALYQLLLEHARTSQLSSLENVIVAGETVPPTLWVEHSAKIPLVQLHNEYGPTEGTVWAIAHRFSSEDTSGPVPLGRPIPRTEIHLLDPLRNPVPLGAPGELYISGLGVAQGYCNSPKMTTERFIELSFGFANNRRCYATGDLGFQYPDGKIGFLGRRDRQVKIRGHRVELGEIENVLRTLPGVGDAFVQVISGSRIVAHVCAPAEYHSALINPNCAVAHLPGFMTPDVIVPLERFPQLDNGKTDYTALPPPPAFASAPAAERARNPTEAILSDIWTKVLKIESVGIHDNFFSLGGDSILSIQIISRARRAGINIEPRDINDHPTIAQLSAISSLGDSSQATTDENSVASFPLTPVQSSFLSRNLAAPHHWNQSAMFELSPACDQERLTAALRTVIAAHPQLNARFKQDLASNWMQSIEQPLPAITIARQSFDASNPNEFEAACLEIQANLNLSHGPLFRIVHFTTSPPYLDKLLFAVHHLVIDAASWQIIIDDISKVYADPNRVLSAPNSPFSQWTLHLEQEAKLPALIDDLPDWIGILSNGTSPPSPPSIPPSPEQSIVTIYREFDHSATTQLRSSAHQAYRTDTQDLLLTALAMTINHVTSSSSEIVVDLEFHGRPQSLPQFDFSRTVGRFTSLYPVKLHPSSDDLGQSIRSTKEHLRHVAEHGYKFGLLRQGKLETSPQLQALPAPWIRFNYLGEQTPTSSPPDAPLRFISSTLSTDRSPLNICDHALEITASFVDSCLQLKWSGDPTQFDSQSLTDIAERFDSELRKLLRHCEESQPGFTPSDFPESDLQQEDLDSFLSEFD